MTSLLVLTFLWLLTFFEFDFDVSFDFDVTSSPAKRGRLGGGYNITGRYGAEPRTRG